MVRNLHTGISREGVIKLVRETTMCQKHLTRRYSVIGIRPIKTRLRLLSVVTCDLVASSSKMIDKRYLSRVTTIPYFYFLLSSRST